MSQNPLQSLFHAFERFSNSIQNQFSNFVGQSHNLSLSTEKPLSPVSSTSSPSTNSVHFTIKEKSVGPVTKEELGKATWTFLHTLAAQYPDNPTRQQKKDVKELMAILSRMYPCQECADHFKEVLRANPVKAGSHEEFSQWLCHIHNVVNRSLGKRVFPCERVDARWGRLECEQRACDLQGDTMKFDGR